MSRGICGMTGLPCSECNLGACSFEIKELKPCPFCGGEAKVMDMGYPHWVYCTKCGAKVHGGVVGAIKGVNASIEAWNRRTE